MSLNIHYTTREQGIAASCEIVEGAGFVAPFIPDTPLLAPAPQGHRGYGEGREPHE